MQAVVRSLSCAADAVDLAGEEATLLELCREQDLPPSTMHRLVGVLSRESLSSKH